MVSNKSNEYSEKKDISVKRYYLTIASGLLISGAIFFKGLDNYNIDAQKLDCQQIKYNNLTNDFKKLNTLKLAIQPAMFASSYIEDRTGGAFTVKIKLGELEKEIIKSQKQLGSELKAINANKLYIAQHEQNLRCQKDIKIMLLGVVGVLFSCPFAFSYALAMDYLNNREQKLKI